MNEYGSFEPVKGQRLNGKLTLSENTADNGALRIAYIALMDTLKQNSKAAQDVDGYTPAQQYSSASARYYVKTARMPYRVWEQGLTRTRRASSG